MLHTRAADGRLTHLWVSWCTVQAWFSLRHTMKWAYNSVLWTAAACWKWCHLHVQLTLEFNYSFLSSIDSKADSEHPRIWNLMIITKQRWLVWKILSGKVCHITKNRGNNLGADLDLMLQQKGPGISWEFWTICRPWVGSKNCRRDQVYSFRTPADVCLH
jgi:hypothetical protein